MLRTLYTILAAVMCMAHYAFSQENPPQATAMKQCIIDEVNQGVADFKEWKGNDLCVTFPIITDLHSHVADVRPSYSCMGRLSINHLAYLNLTAEAAGADFAADLGDDGFDVPLKKPEEMTQLLSMMESHYRQSKVPMIHCIGNHDAKMPGMDNASWGEWLTKANNGKKHFVTGGDGSYGYYDVPGKNCRVFFLNTSELNTIAGMSDTQLEFLKSHLDELSKDQTAVVLSHIFPHVGGIWLDEQTKYNKQCRRSQITKILTEFAAKGGKLAGIFSGDSHFDIFDYENGVNFFCTQGYGGIGIFEELPPHARTFHYYTEEKLRYGTFNYADHCLIDLVAIKLDKREIRVFRIGAGGFYYHRGTKF